MNKIIVLLFLFITAQSCAQIDPYQIIKDSLGAHRILLTDSTGEYTRVLLRDAIADSIGVGKFVNGADPLDAVYMNGNVGIGTEPSVKLDVNGDMEVGGDLQSRLTLNSKKDGVWLVGSYMSTIRFRSEDTSGNSGASTRAAIRIEPTDDIGSLIVDGSDVNMVFKLKRDVAGLPPDAMILHSNKDLEILGGISVAERTGTANKSAFFDVDGNLIEGDIVSGAYVGYGGIKSVFKTINSTSATLLNLQNTFGSTNTVLGNTGNLGKITVDSSGYWQVIVSGGISDYTVDEKLELEIWVNGVSKAVYNFWKPEEDFAINVTHVLDLQNDDYVQLKLDSVTDNDYNYSGVKLVLTRLADN